MRILGIDYGTKRVGVAASDEEQKFAFPKVVLANDKKLMSEIVKLCTELEVEKIVVGESRNYKGEENEVMKEIVPFVEGLRLTTRLPVEMELEFMTSAAAERLQGRTAMLDSSAAALILQSYLDKMHPQG